MDQDQAIDILRFRDRETGDNRTATAVGKGFPSSARLRTNEAAIWVHGTFRSRRSRSWVVSQFEIDMLLEEPAPRIKLGLTVRITRPTLGRCLAAQAPARAMQTNSPSMSWISPRAKRPTATKKKSQKTRPQCRLGAWEDAREGGREPRSCRQNDVAKSPVRLLKRDTGKRSSRRQRCCELAKLNSRRFFPSACTKCSCERYRSSVSIRSRSQPLGYL